MKGSLFEKYGGFASVSRVVMDFYDKVDESSLVSPYFANTDMRRLIDHQTKFMAYLMGGPASYSNDHLERIHDRLGITEEAFSEIITLLEETLEDFDFQEEDIQVISDAMSSRKKYIVTGS